MEIKEAKFVGFVVGLLAVAFSVGLLVLGKLPDLGKWWVAIGVFTIVTIGAASWKITRGWLAPTLLCGVIILVVASYLITNFLLPNSREEGRLIVAFWLGMVVDAGIVILSVIWLILHTRNWLRWLRENGGGRTKGTGLS